MVYFDGYHRGALVRIEDWYKDDLVYVNIRLYCKSTAVSRPDREKSFLIQFNDKSFFDLYKYSIVEFLISQEEYRDKNGCLVPIKLSFPAQKERRIYGTTYPNL